MKILHIPLVIFMVVVAGRTFDAGAITCTYTVAPTNAAFGSSGGSSNVNVTASATNCFWIATSNNSFITIPSSGAHTGSVAISYSVGVNTTAVVRVGTMSIAGQTVTITQAAGPCVLSLGTTIASFGAAGGSSNVVILANGPSCVWTAISNSAFVTITSATTGSGTGSVTYSVASNPNTEARSGTLTLAGQTFAVAQDGLSQGSIVIDGSADAAYGSVIATQQVGTAFGKNTNPAVDAANGSELDAAYGVISNGVLYLVLAGNLEANFNKLEVFIQTGPGGQNTLTNINPTVDFNGLNRMGADGNGATPGSPGLTFDAGFAPTYWIGAGGGGTPYSFYVNYAALWPIGGGSAGYYLGHTTATVGTLSGGSNPFGIRATIDNSNVIGVNGDPNGCDTNGAPLHPQAVRTGVELAIPLGAIGNPTGSVKVCAFIISQDYTYLSNQLLGPLDPGINGCIANLGEPTVTDFGSLPGTHYFAVGTPPCNYSISPLSAFYGSSGGTGSVAVTVQSGCSWTATSNAGWITITSANSGSGNGSVNYTAATNLSTCARTGSLTVAGQTFAVSQGGVPLGPITIDGTADAVYGAPKVSQQFGTTFGKNSNPAVDAANGSELDAAYGIISNGVLYLVLAGNLEANFNDLEVFIQTGSGGQSTLTNINPNVDGNGLNRMGAGGNGATPGSPGLTFDAGFAPNYWIGVDGGGAPYTFLANYAQLWPGGGGSNGYFLGQTTATQGTLLGGTNPFCIQATIDNSNLAGVNGDANGCYSNGAPFHPEQVTTGVELAIPLGAIGNPTGSVAVCAFINGAGHVFISNQILGSLADVSPPLGSGCQPNLGEPTTVNLSTLPGVHSFLVGGCNYLISPVSAFYGSSGGSSNIGVTANNGCSWTATSNAGWIMITSGNSGSGNGTVNYSVASNSSTCVRIGTLTVAGQTVTITQSGSPLGPIAIDGYADAAYGTAIATQQLGTAFGKNTNPSADAANGSELDAAYGVVSNGVLYLVLAGNLEANFDDLEVFIQTGPGGQNTLTNINPIVDFNGLNRMGAGGNGATPGSPGLTFDAGFAPNYWFGMDGGGTPYAFFANYAQLWPGGGGNNGYFLGQTTATQGTLLGGTNPFCIQATIDNSNIAGVSGDANGCYSNGAPYLPETVRSGVELAIPLGAIGNPTGSVAVCAFINGGGHAYISNQILGPMAPGVSGCISNLAEPTTVNFSALPGVHYFTIAVPPCIYSISPTNVSYAATGGSGSIAVTAGNGCSWTAMSNAGWITITSGTSGSGNGSVNYTVGINSNTTSRIGTLTVAGQLVTVTQSSGDSVGDGIPDWWRAQYFGGNGQTTNIQSCAVCDPDGDGMSNLQEFLAGTDPGNSSSAFRITSIVRTNASDLLITWTTGLAKTNALQVTTNFPAVYADIYSVTNTTSTVTNYTDLGAVTNKPSRFYRVRLVP